MPFNPPANLNDFEFSRFSTQLRAIWDAKISDDVNRGIQRFPAYFSVENPPMAIDPDDASPEWTGLPRTMKRRVFNNVKEAAKLVENPIHMGAFDPIADERITSPFHEVRTGREYPGPMYRPQDEYLEWVTRRDPSDRIVEIVFTAEGPEYWDTIALDEDLLLALYQKIVSPAVDIKDLYFDRDVCYWNGNQGGSVCYNKGDYNRYNKWNMAGAVHLTQPANTLGAEINLAKNATKLYGDSQTITTDPQLVTCGGYGGINRMSDPTIGATVNGAVRGGKFVALRDPVGLYIKGIDEDAFELDGNFVTDINSYFVPTRPEISDISDMIVRAKFRVPDGVFIDGRQATISDMLVDGEKIEYGGQVAEKITLRLFAQTANGAPQQSLTPCVAKACPSLDNSNLVTAIDPKEDCPVSNSSQPLMPATDSREISSPSRGGIDVLLGNRDSVR